MAKGIGVRMGLICIRKCLPAMPIILIALLSAAQHLDAPDRDSAGAELFKIEDSRNHRKRWVLEDALFTIAGILRTGSRPPGIYGANLACLPHAAFERFLGCCDRLESHPQSMAG